MGVLQKILFAFVFLFHSLSWGSSSLPQDQMVKLKAVIENNQQVLFVSPEDMPWDSSLKKSSKQRIFITTERQKTPEESTGDIVKNIRESSSPVLLICQDKAAADCLSALILYPRLRHHLSSFISLNGKISGAEYAEKAPQPLSQFEVSRAQVPLVQALRVLVDYLYSFVNEFEPGLFAMKPESRSRYLKNHKLQIEQLLKETPVISLDFTPKQYGQIPGAQASLR